MPSAVTISDRPFDRLWQPGHPFRPRRSSGRRWSMISLLLLLASLIGTYWWMTDPERIRKMSESYLSELTGGQVHVARATLSVFEGLKLNGVSLKVGNSDSPDDVLFFADTFDIQYDPGSLLKGQLEATRIIATGPRVQLAEDVDTGKWNYQKLTGNSSVNRPNPRPTANRGKTLVLPEVVLRNAEVQYAEYRAGQRRSRGMITLEGRLAPSRDNSQFNFQLQSRGTIEGVGPAVSGNVALDSGHVLASLSNFRFGRDVEAMLPSQVRSWWQLHQLEGGLDIPEFNYTPAVTGRAANFHVKTHLSHVRLAILAQEIAGNDHHRKLDRSQQAVDFFKRMGMHLAEQSTEIESFIAPPPVPVEDVTGDFSFDANQIVFENVTGNIEGNTISANGKIGGYSPDAPFHMHLESKAGTVFRIPNDLGLANSLPNDARDIYNMIKPHGDCTFWLGIDRTLPGSRPEVTGEMSILNGQTACIFFPYPVEEVKGKLVFGSAGNNQFEHVEIQNIRGHGVAGGPNANSFVTIGGWVGPFDNTVGLNLRIIGENITSEPKIFEAFQPAVRDAMTIFEADAPPKPGTTTQAARSYPQFRGDFLCDVIMPIGIGTEPAVSVDIKLADASGRLAMFPYPLRHLSGLLQIREGYLNIVNIAMKRGDAEVVSNGKVSWTKSGKDMPAVIVPQIAVKATNVPIDDELLNALPEDKRLQLKKIGLTGKLDVEGDIFAAAKKTDTVDFKIDCDLHDASVWPIEKNFAATDVSGHLHYAADRVDFIDFKGVRGEAQLTASGVAELSGENAGVKFAATAKNLNLDDSLHRLLPAGAQNVWDSINPTGSLDIDLTYAAPIGSAKFAPEYSLTLKPRQLSVTPKILPYRLDNCGGSVTATPVGVTLKQFSGKHGNTSISLTGTGVMAGAARWDLSLSARDIQIDHDLLAALPAKFKKQVQSYEIKGPVSLDLKQLIYQAKEDQNAPGDFDISGAISTRDASALLGAQTSNITGSLEFDTAIRNGQINAVKGEMNFESLDIADRPLRHLKAEVSMPTDSDLLRISNIEGDLAGGPLAGNVNLKMPEHGPVGYSLNMVLKNADVNTVGGLGSDIRGQLSASLALEGEWPDISTRRGRGDVLVVGQKMYQIPLLLGLFEITDLSLPSTKPFNEGTARYAVDGKRITFDQIQLRSDSMVMGGSGYMDFGTKKVRMNFSTDNPNMPKLPFVHDLWQGAKQELFQIQVRGTIQEPKVSAASFHTFTTTVDEVFNGNGKEK